MTTMRWQGFWFFGIWFLAPEGNSGSTSKIKIFRLPPTTELDFVSFHQSPKTCEWTRSLPEIQTIPSREGTREKSRLGNRETWPGQKLRREWWKLNYPRMKIQSEAHDTVITALELARMSRMGLWKPDFQLRTDWSSVKFGVVPCLTIWSDF